MEYSLRKANPDDADRINALFIEMINTIYKTDHADGYESGSLDRFFAGGEEWICVAESGDEVVAFLSIEVHREDSDYIYLDDLAVTEKCRGVGIGTELIQTAEAYARKTGIVEIALHVERNNEGALRLYTRRGYRIDEIQGDRFRMLKEVQR